MPSAYAARTCVWLWRGTRKILSSTDDRARIHKRSGANSIGFLPGAPIDVAGLDFRLAWRMPYAGAPAQTRPPEPGAGIVMRKALFAWSAIAAVGLLAAAARYGLVEPAAIAHLCDGGSGPWWCGLRRAVIASFSGYGLGYGALAAGALAVALPRPWIAWTAAALGLAGLILYCFEASAVGFLLGALVLARTGSSLSSGGDMGGEHRRRQGQA